eukprot:gene30708-29522_t
MCIVAKVGGEVKHSWEELNAAFADLDDGATVDVGVLRLDDFADAYGFALDYDDEVTNGAMLLDQGKDTTHFKIQKGLEGSTFVWKEAESDHHGEVTFRKPLAGQSEGVVEVRLGDSEEGKECGKWRVAEVADGKAVLKIGDGDDTCKFGFDAAYHPDLGTFQGGFAYSGGGKLMGETAKGSKKRLAKKGIEMKKDQGPGLAAPPVFIQQLTTLSLSVMVGYQTVWGVVPALHSPLMAVTNAISGLVVIGGLGTTLASIPHPVFWLANTAVILSSINIAGGFNVTYKMLDMFKKEGDPKDAFCILSINGLSAQESARSGATFGLVGVIIGTCTTICGFYANGLDPAMMQVMLTSMGAGGLVGLVGSSFVELTELPQMVALFHSFVGTVSGGMS